MQLLYQMIQRMNFEPLKLFEKAGVLKVDPKATEKATAKDVIENPKI